MSKNKSITKIGQHKRNRMMYFRYAILILGIFIVVIPMIYMVISSLKDNSVTFIYPPILFPPFNELTLGNYKYILENVMFFRYLFNTIFVSTATVVIAAIISSLLAYSFARLKIPGKKIIFGFLISIMLIPGLAMIIPQFELAAFFGLIDNTWGVILFYSAWVIPFSTFLLKGYIEDNIPIELDESILIDGGSIFTIYRYIIIPMVSPAIAAVSILNFLFPFEELGWSQAILKTDIIRTMPVAITMFFQAHNRTDWGYVFAMSVMAMIPVVIFFLVLQKYFVKGLTSGSVKG
ncbi:MAG TPA: carbohydrate ABC transporter permease [Erysipelotrichaceae bacterium]|nr:carbohydrate ABC transporter permease [Erysipelotrichaceae bacterium]